MDIRLKIFSSILQLVSMLTTAGTLVLAIAFMEPILFGLAGLSLVVLVALLFIETG